MDITDKVQASQILTENVPASEWADITIDGKIYAGVNKRELHIVVNLSKKLLENAGIDYKSIEPTLEGYYNVFKALREGTTAVTPKWLTFDAPNLTGTVNALPAREDIDFELQENMIVEFYSR